MYNPYVPHLFLDDYIDEFYDVDWATIIRNNKIIPFWWYEKHFDKFKDFFLYFQINTLLIHPDITESFIEKWLNFYETIYWDDIITNSKLQYSFYLKHKSKIPLIFMGFKSYYQKI